MSIQALALTMCVRVGLAEEVGARSSLPRDALDRIERRLSWRSVLGPFRHDGAYFVEAGLEPIDNRNSRRVADGDVVWADAY
jgi:hypothetical protein